MNLRHLDLSLISESIALRDLLHAIMPLTKLVSLCFPRSSTNDAKSNSLFYSWPTNLQKLHLAGGIQDTSLFFFTNMPETLSSLTIEHCPNLTRFFIWGVLPTLSSHLTHLKISYHMAKLSYGYLDGILFKAMNLRSLSISVDYISHKFFVSAGKFSPSHPLEMLELDDSGAADLRLEGRISANRVFFAVSDGGLGNLRRVRVNKRLGWQESPEGREDVEDLNDLLEVKAREDAVMAVLASGTLGPTSEAGVWVFE